MLLYSIIQCINAVAAWKGLLLINTEGKTAASTKTTVLLLRGKAVTRERFNAAKSVNDTNNTVY